MKPIIININDEYKIKIENGNEFKGSIFEEVYNNAAKNLCDIIFQSINNNTYDTYNNIIAFTGERGKGKSSSMISFRNALLDYKNKVKHSSFFNSPDFDNISKSSFAEIDIIDPSLFRGNESLFEIIVAKMFSKFQELIKKENCGISDEDRRTLIKLFQQVFDNLKIINSDKKEIYNLDSLEALSNLAYSSNLRKGFSDLVGKYLNVLDDKKSFLIVSIDDFDLNISKAYEMLEDIRHFLIQKRIILLIACKTEQLKDSIINEIVKEYRYKLNLEQKSKIHNFTSIDERKSSRMDNRKITTDFEITNEFILTELSNKAEKYIEKLIPFNHQIFIPSLTDFCDIHFSSYQEIEDIKFTFFDSNNDDLSKIKNESIIYIGDVDSLRGISLENILEDKNEVLKQELIIDEKLFIEKNVYDCLLKLIYTKSKVFIDKTDYRYQSIFPSTLRELNELIKVFDNENVLENFRKYILNKSINELPENLKKIILDIDKQDFSSLNLHIIHQLVNIEKSFQASNDTNLQIDYHNLNPSLTSIGDVFSIMKLFYENVKSTNIYWYKFLDYLSIYYSVRINQIYTEKPNVLLEYCKGGLYDGEYRIFPVARIITEEGSKNINRDWIEYKLGRKPGHIINSINSIFKSLEETDAYWLAFFIQFFGDPDSINEYSYPYFRKINQGGGIISHLVFSPFAIFTNILFPVEVWNSIFSKDFDFENIIMQDILKWKHEHSKFQILLMNPMFFRELTENLSRYSATAFKSSNIQSYYDTIYVYFNDSLKKAINTLTKKYDYLNLDENCFDSHPIMLHWNRINSIEENKNKMSNIFQAFIKVENIEMLETVEQNSDVDINYLKKKFNYYKSYLLDENENTRSLTHLVNSFQKHTTVYKDLSKIRTDKKKSVMVKKTEAYNYLLNIING
ncbi:hypothetical protein [Flavobacterium collinsii]|uniref:KAP NTPase domain-containing protein n=1 Tax=Flavobacterium collinsii TaxID=1114861 RepID=A0A9W4THK8_9FLAO|nr:hypothetical protein [Flavobacterium collinsii]CAI2768345.1 conserved protein of unknown function [Flavobacterium collinsii]